MNLEDANVEIATTKKKSGSVKKALKNVTNHMLKDNKQVRFADNQCSIVWPQECVVHKNVTLQKLG